MIRSKSIIPLLLFLFNSILSLVLQVGCTSNGAVKSVDAFSPEKYRPRFHFTPDSMWMNDPNGLVYLDGEYHLFYQYYPDSTVWGPMHWGHAVSSDLVHWKHLPIALYPDSLGYIFSGSAVVDAKNTTGFGTKNNPPLVAIFTYHDMKGEKSGRSDYQSQGIAYSTDKGRTWTKYSQNPVLKNPGQRDFRDPKVSWNEQTRKWIMTMASGDHVCFYSSPNLKEWALESEFGKGIGAHGGVWECPDLIKLPVTNENGVSKWVLLVSINPGGPNGGSATQYFVGEFDGHSFTNESKEIQWVDQGKDNYAGVTYSNIPETDGRCITIGWMSNWLYAQVVPTRNWRSAMTFPREFKLIREGSGYLLTSSPVAELQLLREVKTELTPLKVSGTVTPEDQIFSPLSPAEFNLSFKLPKEQPASDFGLILSNKAGESLILGYNTREGRFYINRENAGVSGFSKEFAGTQYSPFKISGNEVDFHVLLDEASVELFAMDGKVVMTDIFFPTESYDSLSFFTKDGEVELNKGVFYRLSSQ